MLRPLTAMRESPVSAACPTPRPDTPRPDTPRRTPPIPIPGGGARRPVQVDAGNDDPVGLMEAQLPPHMCMSVLSEYSLSRNHSSWELKDKPSSPFSIYSTRSLYATLLKKDPKNQQKIIQLIRDKFVLVQAFNARRSNLGP